MVDFPRGGSSTLSQLEIRDIQDQVVTESINDTQLFNQQTNKKKRTRKIQDDAINSELSTKKKSKIEKLAAIESLSFKKLHVGMTLLGSIKEIKQLDLVISLPNLLTGFVSITDISEHITAKVEAAADIDSDESDSEESNEAEIPDLSSLFKVGQLITTKIINLESPTNNKGGQRRILLSVDPKKTNADLCKANLTPGMLVNVTIKSEEDHGYIVGFGGANDGFLPSKNCVGEMKVGQVLYASVVEVGKIIKFSVANEKIQKTIIPAEQKLVFSSILPGFQFSGTITTVLTSGYIIKFQDCFDAVCDLFHSSSSKKLKVDEKINFRILYVDAPRKRIGITMNPHLLGMKSFNFDNVSVDVGDKMMVKLLRVDDGRGLVFKSDVKGLEQVLVYAHKSKVYDTPFVKFSPTHTKLNSTHECRVISFNFLDGIIQVTLSPSNLSQKYTKYSDIVTGMNIKCKITSITDKSIFVSITDTIAGMIPKLHMSDVLTLTNPAKLFKIGGELKVQVLDCQPEAKRLILTNRKSIINSPLGILSSSYEDIEIGTIAHGVISNITEFGVFVGFHSNLKGFAHVSECAEEFIKKPDDVFVVGQVVKARILGMDKGKLKLSFKISGSSNEQLDTLSLGQILSSCTVKSKTSSTMTVSTADSIKGLVELPHLSDISDSAHLTKLLSGYKIGDVIANVVVIGVDRKRGLFHASLKGELINDEIRAFDNVKIGLVLPGFIKKILDGGCIVGFVGGMVGFCPLHSLSDKFVKSASGVVTPGQTVIATVTDVDAVQQRISVSLKNSVVFPTSITSSVSKYETSRLATVFQDKKIDQTNVTLNIGDKVSGVVKQKLPYGVIVVLDDQEYISGLITTHQCSKKNTALEVGEKVEAFVLDIDLEQKIADLCLGVKVKKVSTFLNQISQAKESAQLLDAVVEIIKEDYLIVTLPSLGNTISYATVKTYNSLESPFQKFKQGQRLRVIITQSPSIMKGGKKKIVAENQRIIVVPRKVESTTKESNVSDSRRILNNPIDSNIKTLDDVTPGILVKMRVKSVKSTQINVELASNLNGRIHICEVSDTFSTDSSPFNSFKTGDIIQGKVLGFHDTKTHDTLAISRRSSPGSLVCDITLKKSDLSLSNGVLTNSGSDRYTSISDINTGESINGFIHSVSKECVWVCISPLLLGRVFSLDCTNSYDKLTKIESNFKPGQPVIAKVLSKNVDKKNVDLSLKLDQKYDEDGKPEFKTGDIVPGLVSKISKENGLMVQLASKSYARVFLTDISDEFSESPTESFSKSDLVNCYVLNATADKIDLSLRKSRILNKPNADEIQSIGDVKENMLVKGYVKNVSDSGCFVALSSKVTARVQIMNLSDSYVKNWKSVFPVGTLVSGKAISVDEKSGRIDLSLKKSVVDPNFKAIPQITFASLEVGQKLVGVVSKMEKYGVFVRIDNSKRISGLCHVSEISDDETFDSGKLKEMFSEGDKVKVIVLEIDSESKKISLGLKPSYFNEEDLEDEDEDEDDLDAMDIDEASDQDEDGLDASDDEDSEHSYEETITQKPDEEVNIKNLMKEAAPLEETMSSDESDHDAMEVDDDQESQSEDEEAPKRKSRGEKLKARNQLEKQTLETEQNATIDTVPKTSEDFQRLLLGSPNSSYIWMQYMASELHLGEVDKARAVAENALKTISFRDEKEKLNIWNAYMNLENTFGTPEGLKRVFERAVAVNDPKAVYMQLAQLYIKTEQVEQLVELFTIMKKKFRTSCKVWTSIGFYYVKNDAIEKFRETLQASLKALPKHKHIKIITKFAQFEFKHGEPERGRTIFEGIVSNYPKKVDLWNIYLDMEIRVGEVDLIRRLFERVISLKFSSKKMKFFFKKYLEFEKAQGNQEGIEHVKACALAYVEKLGN